MKFASNKLIFILCVTPSFAAIPPMPFDRWVNQGGNIQVACPAGYTCTESAASDNMLQRILTKNNSGETFVQQIMSDNSGTNGLHNSETFVNASNSSNTSIPFSDVGEIRPIDPLAGDAQTEIINLRSINSGISTRYSIRQPNVGPGSNNNYEYSVELNTGWANNRGQPAIAFAQSIRTTTVEGIRMEYAFDYMQNRDANDRITGWSYGVNAYLQNSSIISVQGGTPDNYRFVLRRASGDFITAGQAVLPPSGGMGGMGMMGGGGAPNPANGAGAPPIGTITPQPPQGQPYPNPPGTATGNPMGMGGGGSPAGGTVAWNTGDEVQVIWIGILCPGCAVGMGGMGGGGGGMMGMGGGFSFQQYENIRTGQAAASRSINSTDPFIWNNPPFGPQPRL